RDKEGEKMLLHRQLTRAAADWKRGENEKERQALLWDNSPRLLRVQEFFERENLGDTEDGTKIERKKRSFRLLRQFCRNLFPSFAPLEQHIWLNQVETNFVRRSVERKRNRTRWGTGTVLAVIIVLSGITFFTWTQKLEADKQRENAVVKEREARYQLSTTYRNTGFSGRYKQKQDPLKALQYLAKAAEGFAPLDKLNYRNMLLSMKFIQDGIHLHRIIKHDDVIIGAKFNSKGNKILTWSEDGALQVWNSKTGEQISREKGHNIEEAEAEFNSYYNHLLSNENGHKKDLPNKKKLAKTTQLDSRKLHIKITGNAIARFSLSWREDGVARFLDNKTGRQLYQTMKHNTAIKGAVLNNDETQIVTWSDGHTARIWNTKLHDAFILWKKKSVRGAKFNSDGSRILTWEENGIVRILNSSNGNLLFPEIKITGIINRVIFNSDESRILVWDSDGKGWIWDSKTGTFVASLTGHTDEILGVQLSRDGRRILTWSTDGTARIWNSNTGAELIPHPMKHKNWILGAIFTPDDTRIFTWSADGTVRLWDSDKGYELLVLVGHTSVITGAVLSDDGRSILTWGRDRKALLWDIANGMILSTLKLNSSLTGAKFSSVDNKIFYWTTEGKGYIWDIKTGQLSDSIIDEDYYVGTIGGAKFNADADRILTWKSDGTARLWDAHTGEPLTPTLEHDKIPVQGAEFNIDENQILTWTSGSSARLWDATTGEPLTPILEHYDPITNAEFDSKGDRILTLTDDGTIRIWDVFVDTDWPENKLVLKTEVESGTILDETGELKVLRAEEWQSKKCEYDKIRYQLRPRRIEEEEWQTSQRLCEHLKSPEVK
ncbi:MAG: hypothetical protein D3922_00865, partial [Candidatus Electrothrix sp. AR1]|nr:hypothetical protein [Candidatus Electrothrix sp. AR1]